MIFLFTIVLFLALISSITVINFALQGLENSWKDHMDSNVKTCVTLVVLCIITILILGIIGLASANAIHSANEWISSKFAT